MQSSHSIEGVGEVPKGRLKKFFRAWISKALYWSGFLLTNQRFHPFVSSQGWETMQLETVQPWLILSTPECRGCGYSPLGTNQSQIGYRKLPQKNHILAMCLMKTIPWALIGPPASCNTSTSNSQKGTLIGRIQVACLHPTCKEPGKCWCCWCCLSFSHRKAGIMCGNYWGIDRLFKRH